jgi:hypothetical protein
MLARGARDAGRGSAACGSGSLRDGGLSESASMQPWPRALAARRGRARRALRGAAHARTEAQAPRAVGPRPKLKPTVLAGPAQGHQSPGYAALCVLCGIPWVFRRIPQYTPRVFGGVVVGPGRAAGWRQRVPEYRLDSYFDGMGGRWLV